MTLYISLYLVFKLSEGEELQSGQSLLSENGLYTLAVQTDGNIVLEKGEDVLWASGTHGKGTAPYMMTMQKDNHLVLRDADGEVIWAPDVYIGKDDNNWAEGGYGVLQTDGNFVVYDGDAKAMWATNTQGGQQGSTDGGIWKGNLRHLIKNPVLLKLRDKNFEGFTACILVFYFDILQETSTKHILAKKPWKLIFDDKKDVLISSNYYPFESGFLLIGICKITYLDNTTTTLCYIIT